MTPNHRTAAPDLADPPQPTAADRRLVLFTALGVVAADWASKTIAAATLDDGAIELGSLLTLRLGHNSGVAFGIGVDLPAVVLVAVTGAVTLVLVRWAFSGLLPSRTGAGLMLGGAVGNLGDRVVGGSVVDFLDLGWWPSFNLADVALTIGVALGIWASLREDTAPSSNRKV